MRITPTFKGYVNCKNCGLKQIKRNSIHFYCDNRCAMQYRKKNKEDRYIYTPRAKENTTGFFEWSDYINGENSSIII
jgi:hypothetical protein